MCIRDRELRMENVCFSYDGADRDYVLDNVSLVIPEHKVTAIVGARDVYKRQAYVRGNKL